MGLIEGRVAIVTGAGAGLGRSYAIAMAREGASIVVNDFAGNAAEDAVREIVDNGGEAVANVGDVGDHASGEGLLKSAIDAYGQIDILVNNAGILRDASFVKMEEAQWDAIMHVHVKALYASTRPVFSWMKDHGGGGVIVNTTSTAGVRGNFGQTNYCTAKCGVIGFTNALAIEGRKYGIRVWNIGPAAATALTAHMPEEYQRQFHIDRVAPTLLYMVSDLSGNQTGKTLLAGGGWVGECRFEVSEGYVPSSDITPQEIARAAADGRIFFPERTGKWVTAYGPQSGE
ncbi:MAG: SDR family NAD(P)-dependent oxidoreductase [Rhodobiaceae bacterium]|nr:SDR family NAD(P)-dependent oxidoreductase [Rhodobiaceae bacterium]